MSSGQTAEQVSHGAADISTIATWQGEAAQCVPHACRGAACLQDQHSDMSMPSSSDDDEATIAGQVAGSVAAQCLIWT